MSAAQAMGVAPHAGQPEPVTGPHVQGGRTIKKYDYSKAIRESVRVETGLDSDADGAMDTVVADIVRPAEAAEAGNAVPVIMLASPFFTTSGLGKKAERKTYGNDGHLVRQPLWYDNYFVEHGYAVVTVDLIGTARSTGCGDVGGKRDVASVTKVIDWLNGRNAASFIAGGQGSAQPDWATGSVGLIGKGYNGAIANGAAVTGVEGLRTIVPLNGISSWYVHNRYEGIPTRDQSMGALAQSVSNRASECADIHRSITDATSLSLGMNPAWAERDYVKDAGAVKASALVVHGQNDRTITPAQTGRWVEALRAKDVSTRVWLSRTGHVDPFDTDRWAWINYLHMWVDYWLSGLPNNVMEQREATVEHTFRQYDLEKSWPVGREVTVPMSGGALGAAGTGTFTLSDDRVGDDDAVAQPTTERSGRKVFVSAPLKEEARLSGSSKVTVRVRTTGTRLPLTVRVADYGLESRYHGNEVGEGMNCLGEPDPNDDGCYELAGNTGLTTDYGVIARGWLNAEYRHGVDAPQAILAGEWMDVEVPITVTDTSIGPGHRLGVVLTLSDPTHGVDFTADADAEFDVAGLALTARIDNAEAITPAKPGAQG